MTNVIKKLIIFSKKNTPEKLNFLINDKEKEFNVCIESEKIAVFDIDIKNAINLRDFLNYALKDYDTSTTETE